MNLLIGDSHTNGIIFQNCTQLLCSAGSAKGLNNPTSISRYNQKIINHLKTNDYLNIFFLFGGVDVDFCFIFKYLKTKTVLDYKKFNLTVIHEYLDFVQSLNKSSVLLSIGLPTLDDFNLRRGLINGHVNYLEGLNSEWLRKELEQIELPIINERTEITLHFNEELEKECKKRNLPFVDITSITYDANLNRIKDDYFSRNDHHNYLRNTLYTPIINNYINTFRP